MSTLKERGRRGRRSECSDRERVGRRGELEKRLRKGVARSHWRRDRLVWTERGLQAHLTLDVVKSVGRVVLLLPSSSFCTSVLSCSGSGRGDVIAPSFLAFAKSLNTPSLESVAVLPSCLILLSLSCSLNCFSCHLFIPGGCLGIPCWAEEGVGKGLAGSEAAGREVVQQARDQRAEERCAGKR